MFMFQTLCIRKRETIIPTICLCSRHCVSERGKLCHAYNMFMFQTLCIRKRETVSYLQCVQAIYWMYQKEENLLCMQYVNVLFLLERGKLYPTYLMFKFQISCIGKREPASYLQYVYVLDFVNQKEENRVIPTVCS